MFFSELAIYLQKLEATTSRNSMVEILADVFHKAHQDEIGKLVYLIQGRVVPLYEAVEFGIADKMIMRAISQAFAVTTEEVKKEFSKAGDLGTACEKFKVKSSILQQRSGQELKVKDILMGEVYEKLYKIAAAGGAGSQEEKIRLLAELLNKSDALSVRYIVRIPLGKLRLGFSDMTVLDGLSWMISGSKEHRVEIERAYNVRPDLGFIAETIKKHGIKGLQQTKPKPGVPILMARAERLSSAKEIIDKIGKCAVEPKIDGFRLQVHYKKIKNQIAKSKNTNQNSKIPQNVLIKLFTRNLEDATFMYPDVVDGIRKQIKAEEAIFEGEAVAFNPQTGEYLPFQETVQRKRKHNIKEKALEIPLKLICFDLLYVDGESLLEKPYLERRRRLEAIIK